MIMGDPADLAHGILEDAMRAGIGDHHRRQRGPGLGRLVGEILQVDIAIGGGFHHHDLHAAHLCAGRVGAMGAGRDKADIALIVAARPVPGLDRQQPRIFALRTAVGLHREGVIAGDLAQLVGQIADRLGIARRLMARREGMQAAEFRPCDRHHLGRGVQLHGAGTQRDHRPVQRQIAVRQSAHVAHHLGFGAVHVKDGMGQVVAVAQQIVGDCGPVGRGGGIVDPEGIQQPRDHARIGRLVEADSDAVAAHAAQIDAALFGGGQDSGLTHADLDRDRVEERLGRDLGPGGAQRIGQRRRVQMHPLRDGPQPHRPVEHRIETGHHRQQGLRRADIAGRLLAPDMLFAGLQRQAIGLIAAGIDGDAHDPARHGAFQRVPAGHEGRMGAAIAHRHPESLGAAHGNVGAHGAGFAQQAEGQQIGSHDGQRPGLVQRRDLGRQVADMAMGAGILEDRAEDLIGLQIADPALEDADAKGRGPRLDHGDGLGMQIIGHEEGIGAGLGLPARHRHRLGRRRRLVQQAGIGDGQPGEVGDHGLIIQQRLQPALRDFGLVGGIGGVPGRVFQDVALDRGRRDGAVITLPDQAGHDAIPGRDLLHPGQQRGLGQGGPVQRTVLPDRLGHGLVDQRIQAVRTDCRQHLGHLVGRGTDVTAIGEIVGVVVGRCPAAHPHLRRAAPAGPALVVKYPRGVRGAKRPRPSPGRRPGLGSHPIRS